MLFNHHPFVSRLTCNLFNLGYLLQEFGEKDDLIRMMTVLKKTRSL